MSAPSRSCSASGWWEQRYHGRETMHHLVLHFAGERITGSGEDIIGPFTFEGTLDATGRVRLHKQYLGQHGVEYLGQYDGEGAFAGEWVVWFDRGPWCIRLQAAREAVATELVEIVPVPV
jgi:hypothetical protein